MRGDSFFFFSICEQHLLVSSRPTLTDQNKAHQATHSPIILGSLTLLPFLSLILSLSLLPILTLLSYSSMIISSSTSSSSTNSSSHSLHYISPPTPVDFNSTGEFVIFISFLSPTPTLDIIPLHLTDPSVSFSLVRRGKERKSLFDIINLFFFCLRSYLSLTLSLLSFFFFSLLLPTHIPFRVL